MLILPSGIFCPTEQSSCYFLCFRKSHKVQYNAIHLQHLCIQTRQATATAAVTIDACQCPISRQTVWNRLFEGGSCLTLCYHQEKAHKGYQHLQLDARQWWSSLMKQIHAPLNGLQNKGERHRDACVVEAGHYHQGSVMVWRGIYFYDKLDLVIINRNFDAQRYREQVFRPVVVP